MTDEKHWQLRPARDFNMPIGERLRSQRREPGLISVTGHTLWMGLVRVYLKLAHRLTVTGREHIPRDAPFVLVCNHTSHLDTLSLSAALPRRLAHRTVALAAGDVFFSNMASAIFAATALNALPIWREDTKPSDLAFLRQRMVEDEMVFILFPEGTRSRDGSMRAFRAGLGAMVAGTPIAVVPCHLHGAHACWPATRNMPRPGKLTLTIGPPLRFETVVNDRNGWRAVAQETEAAVRALAG